MDEVILYSPCQKTCPGPLHFHAGGQPPGFHQDPNICPALSHFPLHPLEYPSGGSAAQLGSVGLYGGCRLSCSAPPCGYSTLCSAGPRLFAENWQQRAAVHGPCGAEPKPAEPAPGQEHPGDERTMVWIYLALTGMRTHLIRASLEEIFIQWMESS